MGLIVGDYRQVVYFGAFIATFFSVFLFLHVVLNEGEKNLVQENLSDNKDKALSGFLKGIRPILINYFVPILRSKRQLDGLRASLRPKLISSGLKEFFSVEEFLALKFFLVIAVPLVLFILNLFKLLEVGWVVILLSSVGGFFGPDLWAHGLLKDRKKKVLNAMPFIVDLMALSTEAGLDFVGAMSKVVDKARPSPLIDEFAQAIREQKLGTSRQDSLRGIAARLNMPEINSFIAVLIAADEMGASISKVLKQQTEQIRQERFLRAEKAGGAAATAVLLPTILLLLPAIFIVIGAPAYLDSLGGK